MNQKKTKFTRLEWYWTTADESLFDLSKDELIIYKLLVQEAR